MEIFSYFLRSVLWMVTNWSTIMASGDTGAWSGFRMVFPGRHDAVAKAEPAGWPGRAQQ
jgi:hypothetical protein